MKTTLTNRACAAFTLGVGLMAIMPAYAQSTQSASYPVGLAIPDNKISGLASTGDFYSSEIFQITFLEVLLKISGGYNGDYYVYLTHDSGFSVLLNRVGRDGGNPFGYPDSGLNVTLSDTASNGDIHSYRATVNPGGAALTGEWAPDARAVDPAAVLDSTPRTAFLNSFTGLNPNGSWTLFVADLDSGSVGILESWGLNVTGVPEPTTATLIMVGLGLMIARSFPGRAR